MLQDFNFKIIHRPGLKHANVDALSRNPFSQPDEAEVDIDDHINVVNMMQRLTSSVEEPQSPSEQSLQISQDQFEGESINKGQELRGEEVVESDKLN